MTPEEKQKRIAELEARAAELAKELEIPMETGSGAVTDPIVRDIYPGTDALRLGFGDMESANKLLSEKGYKNAKVNKYGRLVAQDEGGNWVSDDNSLLYGAPKALPAVASTVAGMFPAGRAARILMSGLGGGAGEYLKQKLAGLMGTKSDPKTDWMKVGVEGVLGAGGEGVGQAVGKIPLGKGHNVDSMAGWAARKLLGAVESGSAKSIGFLSGAGTDAARRTIERPNEVTHALEPESVMNLSNQAKEELTAAMRQHGREIKQARREAINQNRGTPVSTESVLRGTSEDPGLNVTIEDALDMNTMGPKDIRSLQRFKNRSLLQPEQPGFDLAMTEPARQMGLPLETRVTRPINMSRPGVIPAKEVQAPLGVMDREVRPMNLGEKASREEIQMGLPGIGEDEATKVAGQQLGAPLLEQRTVGPVAGEQVFDKSLPNSQLSLPLLNQRSLPVNTATTVPGPTAMQYGLPLPPPNRMQMPFENLLRTVGWLDRQILKGSKDAFGKNLPHDALPPKIQTWKALRGKIKRQLHEVDPTYAAADAKFTEAANQAELLDPLTNEATSESFITSLSNPAKREKARQAAKALTPRAAEGVQDMIASSAFERPETWRHWISPRRALTGAATGIGLGAGVATQTGGMDPTTLALAGGLGALVTSPALGRAVLANGSRFLGTPWSLLKMQMKPVGQGMADGLVRGITPQVGVRMLPQLLQEE